MSGQPTISDVAARAGVSKTLVSFVLNDRPGVSADARSRILQAVDDLGFRPNRTARALSSSKASAIGLVLARQPEMLRADSFFPPFIAGVEKVIAPADMALMLRFVPDASAERAAYTDLSRGRADGVIVTDIRSADPRPALLAQLGLPAVTLNRPVLDSPTPAVCLDDTQGIRAAVDHLIGLGHRNIAHVGGPIEYLHSHHRRQEWSDAMAAARLPPGRYLEADFTAAGGARATAALLDGSHPPTAILYASDLMAMAGMAEAHRRGMRIPEELSVVGFDDSELSAHLHPPLTTVRTDAFGWGQAAANTLISLLAGHPVADVELPAAVFVLRESTAPPP
ncbi:LacI family DNA-binding transcriptional regulator [Nakamurella sp. PAMC28650]|uniref:LacI family DNA-binding transcriptional regulator n=1 Tax=Nakamurella sp. PAMC28650 TaxID=2762325 RepID=UPI001C9AFD90|nr:LacI family DNA-binding transcriptional regulator [Nakamurella sp. PAMC28650]